MARAAPSERPANDDTHEADAGHSQAAAAPSRLANLGESFKPEIYALRGAAVSGLLAIVREVISNNQK